MSMKTLEGDGIPTITTQANTVPGSQSRKRKFAFDDTDKDVVQQPTLLKPKTPTPTKEAAFLKIQIKNQWLNALNTDGKVVKKWDQETFEKEASDVALGLTPETFKNIILRGQTMGTIAASYDVTVGVLIRSMAIVLLKDLRDARAARTEEKTSLPE